MCLQIHEFLLVSYFLQAGEFPLFKMDLVLHKLFYRPNIILNNVLIGVNVSEVFDFLSFKLLFFLSSSFLLKSTLLSQCIQSRRGIVGI